MKIKILTGALIFASIAGCASTGNQASQAGGAIDYAVFAKENANRTGIAQVFEMDGNTVVQMRDTTNAVPRIVDEDGNAVPFKQTGNYLVLQRAVPKFTVVQGSERATIAKALGLPVDGASPSSSPAPGTKLSYTIKTSLGSLPSKGMNDSLSDIAKRDQYLKAIETLQAQINEIKTALAGLDLTGAPIPVKGASYAPKKLAMSHKARKSAAARKNAVTGPRSDPAGDNAIAKLRADVVRGIAPASTLDGIDRLASSAGRPVMPKEPK